MIKKRLLGIVPESKKYIAQNVLFQWLGMGANVVMVITIAQVLNAVMSSEDVDFTRSILIIMKSTLLPLGQQKALLHRRQCFSMTL